MFLKTYLFSVTTLLIWVSFDRSLHSASIEQVRASTSSANTEGSRLTGSLLSRATNGLKIVEMKLCAQNVDDLETYENVAANVCSCAA